MSLHQPENLTQIFLFATILLISGLLTGCSDTTPTNTDPPDETEMVTMQLVAEDSDGKTIAGAVFYEADTDTQLENPVEREKGSELDVRSEADGYQTVTKSVSFTTDGETVFTLNQDNPDEVTITYEIRDTHGTAVDGAELTSADTLVATGPNGSVTVPYSETAITFCGSANYYEQGCEAVEPTEDQSVTLTLILIRETVEITITPEIVGYDDIIRRQDQIPNTATDNTIYKIVIEDSVWIDNLEAHDNVADFIFNPHIAEGKATKLTYPTGPNPIQVSMRAVYVPEEGHAYSDEHYLNVAEGSITLPGDSDSEIQLDLVHIPACSDGVDNTFSGLMDNEERGCTDIQTGSYDPTDDVELIKGISRTTSSVASDGVRFISGAEGEQRHVRINSYVGPMTSSIKAAMEIVVKTEIKVSTDQSGQEFALEYAVGSVENNLHSVNQTEIFDADGQDGWIVAEFTNITRDFFAEGLEYEITAVHARAIRNETPSNGNDRIVFAEGVEVSRAFNTQWIYQPEDVPATNQKQIKDRNGNVMNIIDIHDSVNPFQELERFLKK